MSLAQLSGGKKLKAASGRDRDAKLLEAARRGNRSDIVSLLKKGAGINVQDDQQGLAPLHLVCMSGNLECLQCLLANGAECALRTGAGQTPLHIAAGGSHVALVEALLKQDDSVLNDPDGQGVTPLMSALVGRANGCVAALMGREDVDVRAKDVKGRTALHLAASEGFSREVGRCCRLGAEVNEQDGTGQTPLHYAAAAGATGCISALLGHGAQAGIKDSQGRVAA
eukprot:CAMPEP_0119138222 /NCGR_PEP_ID=MMETSP1310-20130426/25218_1 /TAXON_ID=464262 /ORGANISM="Genus nov. species nov., Strain RCC2339" /LENGTH=225 /DNA_ID=CAMNT_0007129383 /DNA_START=92 /DNA_END=766 /DNA_ORIENTATION=-